jgi:TrmH family RNA methyltransferase
MASVSSWDQAAKQLEAWGCSLHAADAGGSVLHSDVDWRRPAALVLGSEAHGLSPEVCEDGRVETFRIPLMGGVESLNVAVAGSVVLFEVRRQRGVPESES